MKVVKGNISIDDVNLERLRSSGKIKNLRSFVEGKEGVFYHHLPVLDTGTKEVVVNNVSTGLFNIIYPISFQIDFKQLANSDKMEITTYNELTTEAYSEFIRRFYSESAFDDSLSKLIKDITFIQYRIKFLIPLAMSAVIAGTHASVFVNNQRKGSRLLRVSHNDLYDFTRQHMTYTGDFSTDFKGALMALWLNYPVDITGFDNKIKRTTLEEMITV